MSFNFFVSRLLCLAMVAVTVFSVSSPRLADAYFGIQSTAGSNQNGAQLQDQDERLTQLIATSAQESTARYLDSVLSLTPKQEEGVLEFLESNWDSRWNSLALNASMGGEKGAALLMNSIGTDGIANILSSDQATVLHKINEYSLSQSNLLRKGEWDDAEFKDRLRKLLELKIAELSTVFDLDAKQKKQFAVMINGIVAKQTKKFSEVYSWANGKRDALSDPEVASMWSDPLLEQCMSTETWKNWIAKVLDEDQLAEFQRRQEERNASAKSNTIQFLIVTILDAFRTKKPSDRLKSPLTYDEHVALTEMLHRNIEVKGGGNLIAMRLLLDVPESEFESAISSEKWEAYSEKFVQIRANLAGIRQTLTEQKASDADDDTETFEESETDEDK